MSENEDNKENYNAIQEESGFQGKINYAEIYMRLFQGRQQLHLQSNDDAAYRFFYNMLGDFRPLYDSLFLQNYQRIIDSFNNDEQYTDMQAKQQMYRLHVAELASLMERKGISPKPDTTLWISSEDTPKNIKEVFNEDSAE